MAEARPVPFSKVLLVYIFATSAVLVWRILALALGDPSSDATLMKGLLAALGVSFLIAGALVYHRRPSESSALFAAYCVCSALHWGGPLTLANDFLETVLLLFYLVASGTLGETFLLHFALVFTNTGGTFRHKLLLFIYAPAALATLLAISILVVPAGRDTLQQSFLLIHAIVGYVFGASALLLLSIQLFRPPSSRIRRRFIALMIAGLLVAWLPDIIVSAMGGDSEPWLLTFVAIPIAFSVALTNGSTAEAPLNA